MTTEAPAVVEAIYVAATGGAPMRPVERIEAVAGEGLAGDRYPTGRGYWSGMTRALAARRGGICVRVLESGTVTAGDTIEILEGRNLLRAMLRR
jgi:hypothetical protein